MLGWVPSSSSHCGVRQVLSRALEALGLGIVPVDSPDAAGVAENPAREDAFMCNMQVCRAVLNCPPPSPPHC